MGGPSDCAETSADTSRGGTAGARRRLWTRLLPALAVIGVLLALSLAPVSRVAASHMPRPPDDPTPIITGNTRTGTTTLRDVPVGLPAGVTVASAQDIYPYAAAALGQSGAHALLNVLASTHDLYPYAKNPSSWDFLYPYHYPQLEPILNAAPPADLQRGATALAAALIQLAGHPQDNAADPTNGNAAPAAYAVLDRTRSTGGCNASLDLLLLLAGDPSTAPEILATEERQARAACPNEPTPDWIVGQTQLRRVRTGASPKPSSIDDTTLGLLAAAMGTFHDLTDRFPRDTAAISGLGDAYLRSGMRMLYSQPFAARQNLRMAVAQYNKAAELGDAPDADLGRARAFIGLGEPQRAAQLVAPLIGNSSHPGVLLEVLLTADQDAHNFTGAEDDARRLDRAGSGSYPKPVAFYPQPFTDESESTFDVSQPLSTGADTGAPLRDFLRPLGGAGGTVQDLSFIPQYRYEYNVTDELTRCPSLAWRRNAILAGHAAAAVADWPEQFTTARPAGMWDSVCAASVTNLRSIAELVAQQPITGTTASTDDVTDDWQNMLRWAGNLPQAHQVISTWEATDGERSPRPALRLGEVAFLQHDYNAAAAQFGLAAQRARLANYRDGLTAAQAQIDRGAALLAAGRNDEALALLRPLEQTGTQGYAQQIANRQADAAASFAAIAYFAAEQLADHESKTGDLYAATDDYAAALSWTTTLDGLGVRPEVLHNNLAVAQLGLGATDAAAYEAAQALKSDPMDPVFLMTAGFIADRTGKTANAADYDQRALASDPGAAPAANDLGVELARQHNIAAAEDALRHAVGAEPGYALGWFNLGVLESRRGPSYLPASQGAFAKAFALDSTLANRHHDLTIDGSIYWTALDLSKPLPAQWSLAATQKALPVATAGLLAVLVLATRLAKSPSREGTTLAKQWLPPLAARLNKIPVPPRLQHPIWAIAATVITFLLTDLRRGDNLTETCAYTLGVAALIGAAMWARTVVGVRTAVVTTQTSWLPGMVFGICSGALGVPVAPLPVVATNTDSNPVHLAAPLTLSAICALLFAESAWLPVPLTQSLAVAALAMAAATLLPIPPLDGAPLGKAGLAPAAGIIGGAILLALGLI